MKPPIECKRFVKERSIQDHPKGYQDCLEYMGQTHLIRPQTAVHLRLFLTNIAPGNGPKYAWKWPHIRQYNHDNSFWIKQINLEENDAIRGGNQMGT